MSGDPQYALHWTNPAWDLQETKNETLTVLWNSTEKLRKKLDYQIFF